MKRRSLKASATRGLALSLGLVLAGGAALAGAAGAQAASATNVSAADVAADASNYAVWHQGYTGVGNTFVDIEGAVQIVGRSQLLKGFDESDRVGISEFKTAVQSSQITWTTTTASDQVFFQVPVYFGADVNAPTFATLRPVEPITGVNTAGAASLWTTSRAIGATVTAQQALPLIDLIAAIEAEQNGRVLGFGALTNPDTVGELSGINWMGTAFTFGTQPVVEPEPQPTGTATPTPSPSAPSLPALTPGTATLSGSPVVGQTLTVTTADWPAGTTFHYEWFWDGGQMGSDIPGVTGTSYTVTNEVVTRKIGVIVTGSLAGFTSAGATARNETPVTAPQQAAAAPPVANSTDLPAFFAANGVTPLSQNDAGLGRAPLNPGLSQVLSLPWTGLDTYTDVLAYSSPTAIGTFPVVNGSVQIALTPAVLAKLGAGAHTLVVVGQSSGSVQAVSFSIAAAPTAAAAAANPLANTGANATESIAAASVLLLLGAALVVVRRRRKAIV